MQMPKRKGIRVKTKGLNYNNRIASKDRHKNSNKLSQHTHKVGKRNRVAQQKDASFCNKPKVSNGGKGRSSE